MKYSGINNQQEGSPPSRPLYRPRMSRYRSHSLDRIGSSPGPPPRLSGVTGEVASPLSPLLSPARERARKVEVDKFRRWLIDQGLKEWADKIIRASGAYSLEEIKLLNEQDVKEIADELNMNRVTRRKFLNCIMPHQQSQSNLVLISPSEHKIMQDMAHEAKKIGPSLKMVNESILNLRSSTGAVRKQIDNNFTEIAKLVQTRKEDLQTHADSITKQAMAELVDARNKIQEMKELFARAENKVQLALRVSDLRDIDERKSTIMKIVSECLYHKLPTPEPSLGMLTFESGNQDIVEKMRTWGNISRDGNSSNLDTSIQPKANVYSTLLSQVCCGQNMAMVQHLFDAGADVNAVGGDGNPPLWHAARKADIEVVKYLVQMRGDVNSCGNDDSTIFMQAAGSLEFKHKLVVLQYLVENKADIHGADKNGDTALIRASAWGNLNVIKFLLENKADINVRGCVGNTPLLKAAGSQLEILQFIVEQKGDLNMVTEEGQSALHRAVEGGHIGNVRLLLESNVDANIKDKNGETPLELARSFLSNESFAKNNSSARFGRNHHTSLSIVELLSEVTHILPTDQKHSPKKKDDNAAPALE